MLPLFFVSLISFQVNAQNCPDDINNSPGNSNSQVNAIVYDSNGDVIQSINCDATGNSGQVDCDLSNYNFPPGSIISIDLSNGQNSNTCFYDSDGELIDDVIELPVQFGGLKVENVGQNNILVWKTYSERNNSFFKLEYSSNGLDWEEVKIVDGAGNSNSLKEYSVTHKNFQSGVNYYRLSQQDTDGKKTYLETISIENRDNFNITFNGNQIEIYSAKKINVTKLFGLDGKIIRQDLVSNSNYMTSIDCQSFNRGIYILQVELADGSFKKKKVFLN